MHRVFAPGVTVVVPNWNRRDLLMNLIAHLRGQTHSIDEIIVVDNGSTDGSAQAAEQAGARVIRLESNRGFSTAVNRGLAANRTAWVAVVNNDVEPAPDWLARLAEELDSSDAWFATGKLLSAAERERIDGTFDLLSRAACAWRAGHGSPDGDVWRSPRPIFFAPFTAALFRAELFEKVGPLDEEFESYLEDVDFGLRCALAGCEGRYVPSATAWHVGSATLGRWSAQAVRRISRNQLLLVARHYPRGWIWRYGWPVMVGQLLWGLVAARHGAGWAWLKGKAEALARFRAWRRGSRPVELSGLEPILDAGERTIRELQRQTGFELFWRLYFALT